MGERILSTQPGAHDSSHADDHTASHVGSHEPNRNVGLKRPKTREHRTREVLEHFRHIESLEDLARAEGPPLSTRELATIIGMSATFIRAEIRTGHLRAVAVGRGRKRVFRITVGEARRYAKEIGLL